MGAFKDRHKGVYWETQVSDTLHILRDVTLKKSFDLWTNTVCIKDSFRAFAE